MEIREKLKRFYSDWLGFKGKRKIKLENASHYIFGCRCLVKNKCGNIIIIEENVHLKNCVFEFRGNNNIITIKENAILTNVEFYLESDENEILIDSSTTMAGSHRGTVHLAAMEGKKIIIGADCMFADDISVRTSDSHSIIDNNGIRINMADDVVIGNHVWVGTGVLILKGTIVPDNCIVGAKTLISKKYVGTNSIIAGIPGRYVHKGEVNWSRKQL